MNRTRLSSLLLAGALGLAPAALQAAEPTKAPAVRRAEPAPVKTAVPEAKKPSAIRAEAVEQPRLRVVRSDLTVEVESPTLPMQPAVLRVLNVGRAATTDKVAVQANATSVCEAGKHRADVALARNLAWAPVLAPGGVYEFPVLPASGRWIPGCYVEVRALVDGPSAVFESNEGNNAAKAMFCAGSECY